MLFCIFSCLQSFCWILDIANAVFYVANQPKGVEVSALKENPIAPKAIMPETETDCQRTP